MFSYFYLLLYIHTYYSSWWPNFTAIFVSQWYPLDPMQRHLTVRHSAAIPPPSPDSAVWQTWRWPCRRPGRFETGFDSRFEIFQIEKKSPICIYEEFYMSESFKFFLDWCCLMFFVIVLLKPLVDVPNAAAPPWAASSASASSESWYLPPWTGSDLKDFNPTDTY